MKIYSVPESATVCNVIAMKTTGVLQHIKAAGLVLALSGIFEGCNPGKPPAPRSIDATYFRANLGEDLAVVGWRAIPPHSAGREALSTPVRA